MVWGQGARANDPRVEQLVGVEGWYNWLLVVDSMNVTRRS